MRGSRSATVSCLGALVALLLVQSAAGRAVESEHATTTVAKTLTVPVPAAGDVTLASAVVTARASGSTGGFKLPRLRVLESSALPPTLSVVASAVKQKGTKNRFLVTVVALNRRPQGARSLLGGKPIRQITLQVRIAEVRTNVLRDLNVNMKLLTDLIASQAMLPDERCGALEANAVDQKAVWQLRALDAPAKEVERAAVRLVCTPFHQPETDFLTLLVRPEVTDLQASCTGAFLPFDMTEVVFKVSCSQLGGARSTRQAAAGQPTRFDITLADNRKVTNLLSPSGFVCTIATHTTTNDTLSCAGTIVAGAVYQGNIRMNPGPTTGMGGTLYLFEGNTQLGSFAMTGP